MHQPPQRSLNRTASNHGRQRFPLASISATSRAKSARPPALYALIRSGKIIHDGDPVLAWAIGNTTGKYDAKDNVYPRKEGDANKIDPVVSLIFAIGRAMTRPDGDTGPFFSFG